MIPLMMRYLLMNVAGTAFRRSIAIFMATITFGLITVYDARTGHGKNTPPAAAAKGRPAGFSKGGKQEG
jgi:hypothetical protein